MRTSQVTVTTSPTKIVGTGNIIREVHIHNVHGDIYIGGDNTVSTTNGVLVETKAHDVMHLPATAEERAVTPPNTAVVYVLEVNQ
jgi:hypothetical protein